MANTGTSSVNADGSVGTVSFTAPYAEYVHEGTGLYGPRRQKIVPKSKKSAVLAGCRAPGKGRHRHEGKAIPRPGCRGA
jgi:hypothetical protein